jgi:hypothetical protein
MRSTLYRWRWVAAVALVAALGDSLAAGDGSVVVGSLEPGVASESSATLEALARRWRQQNTALVKRTWGIDIVGVHPVSSGFMLAFKYKILDPSKAKLLNERKQKAYLVDEATGTILAVPAMENIGELRAATTPQLDRTYFMIFGNPGRLVKAGARVSVVAGDFKIHGLVVE